jgi:hypothetical protein
MKSSYQLSSQAPTPPPGTCCTSWHRVKKYPLVSPVVIHNHGRSPSAQQDWQKPGPLYSGTCLKRHFCNLREETLTLFYKQSSRAGTSLENKESEIPLRTLDFCLIKDTIFLSMSEAVSLHSLFPTCYEPRMGPEWRSW